MPRSATTKNAVSVPAVILPGADMVSLHLPAELSFDEWVQYGQYIRVLDLATPWYIGEWAARADQWPEGQQIIADFYGIDEKLVYDYRITSEKFPPDRRRPGLSYNHHREVRYYKPDDKADDLLEQAELEGWDCKTLRAKAQSAKLKAQITVELRKEGPFFAVHPERIPIKVSDVVARTAPREERQIEIDTNERKWFALLELLQEALDAGFEVKRIAQTLAPAQLDELMQAVVASKDKLIEVIEELERLGIEPC